MNLTVARIAKGVLGVVVILILFSVVTRWYGDYRDTVKASAGETGKSTSPAGESESTSTAAPKSDKVIVVLTNGLNFRDQPSRDEGNKIRGLKKGERLALIKTKSGWYYVEDKSGTRGWISSSKSYTKVLD